MWKRERGDRYRDTIERERINKEGKERIRKKMRNIWYIEQKVDIQEKETQKRKEEGGWKGKRNTKRKGERKGNRNTKNYWPRSDTDWQGNKFW